ncbi:MAG: tryptophan-rich sensory protein [Actinomycetota bacterium]|nr:tryptophan-rich sensory protein [Actinomycetota bacterium]
MSAAVPPLPGRIRRDSAGRAVVMLLVFLAISFAVAAFGSLSTISNVDGWYADAEKPLWNPPNAVFGPVWTVLYTLMSVAAWLVWLRREEPGARRALWTYVVQLVLNAVWTPVFFGAYPLLGPAALWLALGVIVALDVAILLTMLRFWPLSRAAAWLLAPYWAWVLFATTLNAGLAVLNS